ncbi:hypothetical protein J6590_095127 [Homalodisca vitripennis]|nr:hypothetical protein J6590_095127 [Homalodisca vitripennis]
MREQSVLTLRYVSHHTLRRKPSLESKVTTGARPGSGAALARFDTECELTRASSALRLLAQPTLKTKLYY